jgi:hypothetical protein
VNCTKIVYETHTKQVPYMVTRLVPQTHSSEETYTVYRRVPVTHTQTIDYQVERRVPEQHTRTVTQIVTRMTTETGTRTVPYTVWKEVPIERTITVPRTVPRTVTYTVTRCVPRTETYQVPVRVCRPVATGKGPVQRADDPQGGELDATAPADPDSTGSHRSLRSELTHTAIADTSTDSPFVDVGDAQQLFRDGLSRFHQADFAGALAALARAAELDEDNAKYAYFWALAAKQSGMTEQAQRAIAIAVEREANQPIQHWGRIMERVQGSLRLWLEEAREDARAS